MINLVHLQKNQKGFTLIEILVVIGIIAILAAIAIIAINPAKQFAQARNSQRTSNVNSILNSIGQRMADNKGVFAGEFTVGGSSYTCPTIPAADGIDSASGGIGTNFDCLVPTYVPSLPIDPGTVTAPDTGYTVALNAAGRVTVCAPNAATESAVPNAATICATR